MDLFNIPNEIDGLKVGGVVINPLQVSYFLGKENLFATKLPGMALWRERLFAFQSASAGFLRQNKIEGPARRSGRWWP